MKKNLADRVAEKAASGCFQQECYRNRALFLANKEEIKKAFEKGWSIKLIWETLHEEGAYTGKYPSFLKLVKENIIYEENKNFLTFIRNKEKNS